MKGTSQSILKSGRSQCLDIQNRRKEWKTANSGTLMELLCSPYAVTVLKIPVLRNSGNKAANVVWLSTRTASADMNSRWTQAAPLQPATPSLASMAFPAAHNAALLRPPGIQSVIPETINDIFERCWWLRRYCRLLFVTIHATVNLAITKKILAQALLQRCTVMLKVPW